MTLMMLITALNRFGSHLMEYACLPGRGGRGAGHWRSFSGKVIEIKARRKRAPGWSPVRQERCKRVEKDCEHCVECLA